MNCAEIKGKLLQFWCNELSSAEHQIVDAHLRACKRCSREFQFIAGLLRRIGHSFKDEPVPTSLRKRLFVSLKDKDAT